ncbi:M13 family metallopeptidase [Rhodopirellula sp. P2]|uniref:M13 family metallopeptidase n=1 Tax=Rhodopirellula sp. P2 TaxID=2127060 RepID=UPI00236794FB|nr:M13 family metallopeptidase [Rhodopirellula sp. P2]WDQ18034.1 M13 family metallopeptidase [Rhodopirellula sp. P2]
MAGLSSLGKSAAGLALFAAVLHPAVVSAESPGKTSQTVADKVSGIDQSLFSATVEPGQNFYLHANEEWLENTPIPSDKSNYGIFTVLDDATRSQVRALIEQSAETKAEQGTPAQKVGDLYRSVLDLDQRNALGLKPIQPVLEIVDGLKSKKDLGATIGRLSRVGVGAPLGAYISVDAKASDTYTVYLSQSGLSLPDRDYYLEDDPQYVSARQALQVYVQDMLQVLSVESAEELAQQVVAIETELAKNQWTKTENRDPEKTYNKLTLAEVDETIAGFDVPAMTHAIGLTDQDAFVVRQPSYMESLSETFANHSLEAWQAYFQFHAIDAYASALTEDLERRHFEFHDKTISGIDEQQPMWKRAVDLTGSVLGEVVGQLYVEEHFAPEAKRRMNELVENLKRAFAERIESRDWMSEGTKKQALTKLGKFHTKIGYPDEWKDYSKLDITAESPATNLIAASIFETERQLAKLGGPIDRNEWHMTPQTINAYYNPTMNEIVFPAAILQPPFFNLAADDAVNYGGIGAVIGHELSHGFDDKGSKYDGDGNLVNWWTPKDREEFEKRASGLVDQYNEFQPFEDMNVNGELTLGENIGDLGGLSVAYEAYRLSLEGQPAKVIDNLTGDQRFFLGWAQIWRRLYREPELRKRLITDPHSPSEYRVNGIVRNMDAWYEAFRIDETDPLYIAPEERIRIW